MGSTTTTTTTTGAAPAPSLPDPLALLRGVNTSAAFNGWAGIEVLRAAPGAVEIALPWKRELGQYAGFLHAGLIGALIDTACGYAAATLAGRVLASHFAVNCLRPARGERFIARARVLKAGRSQVFTAADLFALDADGQETLVANGEALMVPVPLD
ncbi:MAG TPA: PaaI family thioesterase [Roseateles sp.]|nr:PaaI family thioesterase [Roseateles sp.]